MFERFTGRRTPTCATWLSAGLAVGLLATAGCSTDSGHGETVIPILVSTSSVAGVHLGYTRERCMTWDLGAGADAATRTAWTVRDRPVHREHGPTRTESR